MLSEVYHNTTENCILIGSAASGFSAHKHTDKQTKILKTLIFEFCYFYLPLTILLHVQISRSLLNDSVIKLNNSRQVRRLVQYFYLFKTPISILKYRKKNINDIHYFNCL